jgi:hypothetical protein
MVLGDDRTSSDDGDAERGPAPAERRVRRRSLLRPALVTLALVAVVTLIAIGIVRIVQS